MTREARKYYRAIKTLIPSRGKCGKLVLKSIKFRIREIENSNGNIKYDMLCDILGEPKVIITNYYATEDVETLARKLRIAKAIRISAIGLLVAGIICSTTVALCYYSAYQEAKAAIVRFETITIEDENQTEEIEINEKN